MFFIYIHDGYQHHNQKKNDGKNFTLEQLNKILLDFRKKVKKKSQVWQYTDNDDK